MEGSGQGTAATEQAHTSTRERMRKRHRFRNQARVCIAATVHHTHLRRSPVAPVRDTRSLPARSTKLICAGARTKQGAGTRTSLMDSKSERQKEGTCVQARQTQACVKECGVLRTQAKVLRLGVSVSRCCNTMVKMEWLRELRSLTFVAACTEISGGGGGGKGEVGKGREGSMSQPRTDYGCCAMTSARRYGECMAASLT